jgi:predicted branched-subunit amino acid permease
LLTKTSGLRWIFESVSVKQIDKSFAGRFRQGMKAAIPVWIAFVPSSIAWGIAAQSHQLTLEEVFLLSACTPGRRSLLSLDR